MARSKKNSPWLKETSDRSGFDNFDRYGKRIWRGVRKDGILLAPDEIDAPPPSTQSLGGADISRGSQRTNWDTTDVTPSSAQQIQYITAGGGIRLTDQPWLMVAGSNTAINITANPQIQLGVQNQVIAVQCVGSSVTLDDGDGLTLQAGGKQFVMSSGAIITLVCNRTDNLWRETSRTENGGI